MNAIAYKFTVAALLLSNISLASATALPIHHLDVDVRTSFGSDIVAPPQKKMRPDVPCGCFQSCPIVKIPFDSHIVY